MLKVCFMNKAKLQVYYLFVQLKCFEICKNKYTKFNFGVDLFDHKGFGFHQTVKPHYLINAPA